MGASLSDVVINKLLSNEYKDEIHCYSHKLINEKVYYGECGTAIKIQYIVMNTYKSEDESEISENIGICDMLIGYSSEENIYMSQVYGRHHVNRSRFVIDDETNIVKHNRFMQFGKHKLALISSIKEINSKILEYKQKIAEFENVLDVFPESRNQMEYVLK